MGRGGRSGGQQAPRRPIDLTGTMSVAEKNDLNTLVNAITEQMLKNISNIFDSPPLSPVQNEQGHHHWLSLSILHCKENKPPKSSSKEHVRGDGPKAYIQAHEIIEKEEKKAMTPQLGELKKEAVVVFRKWQAALLTRLRDIHVAETTTTQSNIRGRGRGYRGSARGRGGRGGRNVRVALTLGTGEIPLLSLLAPVSSAVSNDTVLLREGRANQNAGPPRAPKTPMDRELAHHHPPTPNHLWNLPMDRRKLFLHTVLLLSISLQEYTANTRILLVKLTASLNLPLKALQEDEVRIAQGLAQTALDVPEPIEPVDGVMEEKKPSRRWKAALTSASNAATATLSVPLTAAGVGTAHAGVGLPTCSAAGLLGPMAENGLLIGSLFGMSPSRPASKSLDCFAREIPDFGLLPLHGTNPSEYRDARQTPAQDRRLRLVIAMAGWATGKDSFTAPWQFLGSQAECYAMRWEVNVLSNLGSSLETVIKSTAWSTAKKEITSRTSRPRDPSKVCAAADPDTVFSSLIDSYWPVPLLKISKIIDNSWNVGMVRAEKAGSLLADAIMRSKFQGDRPISLIGYSLGARIIYSCLMVLSERRQFGLIDSVVLMGTPAPSESRVWLTLKSVVSGRLINVYSEHDYLLGFLSRTSNIHFGVAGLQDIQGANGVENHRVHLPKGHLSYQELAGQTMKDIGWEDVDMTAIKTEKSLGSAAAK